MRARMADHGPQEAVTRPRPLRGLLLASLPLVLGVGGLLAGFLATLGVDVPPAPGLPFTPELQTHGVAPLPARLTLLGVLLASLVLARPFFAWGRSGRAPHRTLAGILAVLWVATSALLPLLWLGVLQLMREAGSHHFPSLSAGLSESFALTAPPMAGIAGLLAAWLAAFALSARWTRSGTAGSARRRMGVALTLVTLVALSSTVERFVATRLFAHLALGLPAGGWPAAVEREAGRWAVAHGTTLLLLLLLVLSLLPAAPGRNGRVRRTGPLVFVLLLWSAESLVRRAVLHDAASISGAVRLTSAGPVRAAPVASSGEFWHQPGLQAGREGVRATSGRLLSWGARQGALEELLLQEQVDRAVGSSEQGLPTMLGVTLTEGARAEHLACLVAAARARGLSKLVLVGGPPVEVPRTLARAAALIHPELRSLLGPYGPSVEVQVAAPEHWRSLRPSWVVVLPAQGVPFVRERTAASAPPTEEWPRGIEGRGYPVLPLVLETGAPLEGLWFAASKLGAGTFDVESLPPCTVPPSARE